MLKTTIQLMIQKMVTKSKRTIIFNYLHVTLLALFYLVTLMVAPRGQYDKGVAPLLWFIFITVILVSLITTNIIFIIRKKQDKKRIFAILTPLLSLFPFYQSLRRLASLLSPVNSLYTEFPALAILFILIFLLYLICAVTFLINQLTIIDKEYETVKEEKLNLQKRWTIFLERFGRTENPLYFYIISLFIIAILFFSSSLFKESFTIPFGGDFTQQQLQFYINGYDDYWSFFKTGQFPLWDTNTFLGVNNIGSNAFYYALNPFFLPILLFPRSLVPQGISVLMITKFVLAALSMRAYLKYMGIKETTARLFALMYAFCGWNVYYLWFNHFMEVTVMFPLVFLGIEKVFKERQPFFLALSVAIMGLANYFFLVTTCMVGVLYAGFRYIQLFSKFPNNRVRLEVIGIGFLGFLFGILGSGIAFLPGLDVARNSDRVTNATYLDNLKSTFKAKDWKTLIAYLTKWETQNESFEYKKFYPLISFLFPTISDRSVTLLNRSSYDNTISSLFTFTPITLLLIPSLIHSFRKRKASPFIALGLFLLAIFTPFAYNLFHGFTKEYGRWQLFPVFLLITYVASSYEERKEFKRWYFDVSFVVIALLMGVTYLWAFNYQNKNTFTFLFQREYVAYYQFGVLFVVYLTFRYMYEKKVASPILFVLTTIEVVVMGVLTLNFHGTISYQNHVFGGQINYKHDEEVTRKIKSLDGSYYRVYSTSARKGRDNLPMALDYNGVTTFHSLYNFELMDFNYWSKINYNYLGWSLGVHEKRPFLDQFLNIKYYVMKPSEANPKIEEKDNVILRPNVPLTHVLYEEMSTEHRLVYGNENHFNTGFAVDNIMSYEQFDGEKIVDVVRNSGRTGIIKIEELYLKSAILSFDDFNEVKKNHPTFNEIDFKYYQMNAHQYSNNLSSDFGFSKTIYYCSKEFPITKLNSNELNLRSCTVFNVGSKPHVGIVFERNNGEPFLFNSGSIIFQYPIAAKANIYLLGTDGSVVTYDNHTSPSGSTTYKVLRGFSASKAIKRIIIIPQETFKDYSTTYIFAYDESVQNEIIANTKRYPLENLKWKRNEITFTTNFEDEKFVITTIPYDKGWHAGYVNKVTKENSHIKVYKTHGGFVGFVAPKGDNQYSLVFVPEYLTSGLLASFGGFYFAIVGLVYLRYKKKKQQVKAA